MTNDRIASIEAQPQDLLRGKILVVDDLELNREILVEYLRRDHHDTAAASSGQEALDLLHEKEFDLVLIDILMPGLSGYDVLEKLRDDPALSGIPVVVVSAVNDVQSVVRCLKLGARDYLHKPVNGTILRARVQGSLERKFLRDREFQYLNKIQDQKECIAKELEEAAAYVRSLLPEQMQGEVSLHWNFIPSSNLGGDSFGYHWIDDDRFAIYLLDVCGHGVGSALLSVSILNLLNQGRLLDVDFSVPHEVLDALNNTFHMENQNNKYFSIWYGVYSRSSRTMEYCCGGLPPPLLISDLEGEQRVFELETGNAAITGLPEDYRSEKIEVASGSRFYLFSDGIYELPGKEGEMLRYRDFKQAIKEKSKAGRNNLPTIVYALLQKTLTRTFLDDVSIIECVFK